MGFGLWTLYSVHSLLMISVCGGVCGCWCVFVCCGGVNIVSVLQWQCHIYHAHIRVAAQ